MSVIDDHIDPPMPTPLEQRDIDRASELEDALQRVTRGTEVMPVLEPFIGKQVGVIRLSLDVTLDGGLEELLSELETVSERIKSELS